jgi:type IV pilus assembly protein PilM
VNPNDVLRVSLGALASQHDLTKAQIAISVPGHAAFARFATLPPVEPKKVPDIVKFEAMQQIPFSLDQVEWDYQTFVTPDSPDVEVGIFAITRETVMERLTMLQDLGITPNYVVLSPIAAYNALAFDLGFDNTTPGTIIVDVGTTSTDLVIATPGRMWIRTFPIGGHQFTDALVQQLGLSYAKADKIKREAEDSTHARQIFQAMRPSFANLAQDIQRSIGYYQSLNRDANLTRLIGVGSTFLLPGLRKYLKQQLSMDVYRVEEFKKIKAEGDQEAKFNEVSLNFATAYGLALQGLGLNAVGGNLMPVSVLRQSMWKEKVPYFGIAAGIAVAASAAMFLFPMRDDMEAKSKSAPAVLREVAGKYSTLKGEADEAGVLAAGEPDTKAANLVGMLDKREVYQMITHDVQQMFQQANGRAGTWAKEQAATEVPVGPAFTLGRLDTQYLPPTAAAADPNDPSAGASAAPDPLKIGGFPRIECTMLMETNQPEARKFVQETVEKWLKANGVRKNVPYEIVVSDRPFSVTEAGKTAGTDLTAGAGGRGGGDSQRGGERGAKRIGGGREGEVVIQTADGAIGLQSQRIKGAQQVGGSDPLPSSAEQDAEKRRSEAVAEVDKLADFTAMGAGAVAPTTGSVRLNWFVVFKPPATPEGDPAAAPSGGAK